MKIIALISSITVAIALPVNARAGSMDLILKNVIQHTTSVKKSTNDPWSKTAISLNGTVLIPCLIKTTDVETLRSVVWELGGGSAKITEEIVTAKIPAPFIEEIASREDVLFVEFATPLKSKMDTARNATGVDIIQNGTGPVGPYDGKNVVVGLVDETLDYGNPDFTDTHGITRIQYLMQESGGSSLECTKRSIANRSCAITDRGQNKIHGTHVTGIAAGSDTTFKGVAPAADIMFIFNASANPDTSSSDPDSFATTVLEGVSIIFSKADIMDKAAVVNLSLGTSVGAHDGTSLLEQGITSLTTAKPGRIVVNAAGNEQITPLLLPSKIRDHVGGIHASIDVASGSSKAYRFMIISGFDAVKEFPGGSLVNLWLDSGQKDSCSVATFAYTNGRASEDFSFPNLSSTDNADLFTTDVPFASDTPAPVTATGAGVRAAISITAADARNSKPNANIIISPAAGGSYSDLQKVWVDIVVRASGGPCSGNMWLYIDYVSVHDFLQGVDSGAFDVADGASGKGYALANGDSLYTTTIPATAEGVIAVGSFMPPKPIGNTASMWTADNGNTYNQSNVGDPEGTGSVTDDLSDFSSLGPTADGRTKPDIVAPGEPIVSTKARGAFVSSSLTVGENHYKSEGTSMASPHVAGIVALLLQRNNTLGINEVRNAMIVGAYTDGMNAKTPDPANSFGAGKINAVTALSSVSADTSAYHGTGDLEPVDSDDGCTLIPKSGTAIPLINFLIALLILTLFRCCFLKRRCKKY